MNLIRWDPLQQLVAMSNRLNRTINDPNAPRAEDTFGAWAPPVDIFEKDEVLFLRAELPGMRKEDSDLRIENGVLTLTGERRRYEVLGQATTHRLERLHGTCSPAASRFPRRWTQAGSLRAYHDGVLEIQLPKSEASKPQRVEIRTA